MKAVRYRDLVSTIIVIMVGWLWSADIARDFQAVSSSGGSTWYGVYETLAILGYSAAAGAVAFPLRGAIWSLLTFVGLVLMQFNGLFNPEIALEYDLTHLIWGVVLTLATALAWDGFATWWWKDAGQTARATAPAGS